MKGFSLPTELIAAFFAIVVFLVSSLTNIGFNTENVFLYQPALEINVSQNISENLPENLPENTTSENILSQNILPYQSSQEREKFEYQKKPLERERDVNQEISNASSSAKRPITEETEIVPSCTDECFFEGECKSKMLCGNWDEDPCLEWRYVECCSESDCNRDGWYYREYRDYECVDYRCTYFVRERCTDSCYFPRLRSCVGNYVAVCGNFDSDPCLEWNYTEYCEYGCEMGACKKKNECKGTFTGTVERVIDGDTIELEECKERIRLALVDTPEYYEEGYTEAKEFTKNLCPPGSKVTVDQDDGQPYDIYGRIIGVVYCNGKNLNAELVYRGLGEIRTEFCEISEFAREEWAWNYGCRDVLEGENCHPSYPEICIPSPPPDLDCSDIP